MDGRCEFSEKKVDLLVQLGRFFFAQNFSQSQISRAKKVKNFSNQRQN